MATPPWGDSIHSSWLPGILAGAETEVKTSNFGPPKNKAPEFCGKKSKMSILDSAKMFDQNNFSVSKAQLAPLRSPNPKEC